ncbi:MAG: Imm32 family immunity protein [Planctomycetota bacterium]|jgi:hypothetical protein
MDDFNIPDFSRGTLELRFEEDVVCIYGTPEGLKKLSDLCLDLIQAPDQGHIHLETEMDLTENSQNGAIAIFKR